MLRVSGADRMLSCGIELTERAHIFFLHYLENNCTVIHAEFTPPPVLAQ